MAIYVEATEQPIEKAETIAEAQDLFEHFVINEEKVSVWIGELDADGKIVGNEVWKYDPDAFDLLVGR